MFGKSSISTADPTKILTDDGDTYRYVYDAWGRLVEVQSQSSTPLARYRYNGLGHRIGWHHDTDASGTLDATSADPWTYGLYNERWQLVAEIGTASGAGGVAPDDDPAVYFVHHGAGLGGSGSSSYIDDVILTDHDTNGDGALNVRVYQVQNWRHDVVALLSSAGQALNYMDYTPYGEPIDLFQADFDNDGDVDGDDFAEFNTQNGTSDCGPSGCTADFNRDGDVDFGDFGAFASEYLDSYASTIGTLPARAHSRGYAGYVRDDVFELTHTRRRTYNEKRGKFLQRDPMGDVDGMNLYQYARSNSIKYLDPMGLCTTCGRSTANYKSNLLLIAPPMYDERDPFPTHWLDPERRTKPQNLPSRESPSRR